MRGHSPCFQKGSPRCSDTVCFIWAPEKSSILRVRVKLILADSVPRKSEYYVTKQRAARSRSIVSAYSEFVFHGDGWHHAAFG